MAGAGTVMRIFFSTSGVTSTIDWPLFLLLTLCFLRLQPRGLVTGYRQMALTVDPSKGMWLVQTLGCAHGRTRKHLPVQFLK